MDTEKVRKDIEGKKGILKHEKDKFRIKKALLKVVPLVFLLYFRTFF